MSPQLDTLGELAVSIALAHTMPGIVIVEIWLLIFFARCVAATNQDKYTKELTLEIRDELYKLYGKYPYVVINELARWKLDANRDIEEAAMGNSAAEEAFERVRSLFRSFH